MKKLLFILLFIQPVILFSQTKGDYIGAMDNYVKYYNQWLPDSVSYMLPDYLSAKQKKEWIKGIENFKAQYGEITSSKYITLETSPHRIALFKVVYATQDVISGITFEKNRNGSVIPFVSNSPYIDSLLKKEINPADAAAPKTIVYHTGNRQAKTIMITGFVGMGLGSALFFGGVVALFTADANSQNSGTVNSQNQSNNNGSLATGLFVAGAVVFIAGSVMAIGGGIAAHQKHKWSVIAPKNNEIGMAYNF